MTKNIEAVLFDLGGTLRILHKNKPYQDQAKKEIADLVGTDMDPIEFHKLIDSRYDKYREWAIENMRECPEAELWTKWMTPEYDHERLIKNAPALTYAYRRAKGERKLVEGGIEVIKELDAAGYTLGIISNLIGNHEIQDWLREDGLDKYFKTVQLSSVTGIRKPDVQLYNWATEEIGIEPAKCCYIGDQLDKDVLGAKAAGFGMTIAVMTEEDLAGKTFPEELKADLVVHNFIDLVKVFPKAPEVNPSAAVIL